MKRLVSLIFFFLFTLFPSFAHADEGWVINNFDSNIAIQESGEVRVVETIEADFGGQEKHGIYRDIPYVYESNGKQTYTEINIVSVLQNNNKANFETSRNDGYVRIKIGDADKTISGRNVYTITYTARGVLRSFADHDELYWNVTGNYWPVPITYAQATVTLPKEGITKVICYEGNAGSRDECQSSIASSQLAKFSTSAQLGAAQGMTVVVGYTKGLVPILTIERPKSFWEKFIEWPSLLTLLVLLVSGLVTVLFLWNRHGRDYWFAQNIFGKSNELGSKKPIGAHETVTVEFTPPEKLRPAEIGVLMDERADTSDVVATIIDLATRGFLSITEIPKKWMFGKVDYQLDRQTKDEAELLGYEKKLLHSLFKSGNQVKTSTLKNTFYSDLEAVKKALYQDVVDKKLFPSDPEKVRGNYLGIGIFMLILGIVGVVFSIGNEWIYLTDLGIGVAFSGLLLLFISPFMPRRTAYGREMYRRARGYQLFIKTAETHRQKFFEKKNLFNEVLPYAITFALVDKFAKQMKDIGLEPKTTGWYYGVNPMNAAMFGSNMNDFSKSLSSAIASTPSSSGGFSSGGSSGGGFGGGGGGSW